MATEISKIKTRKNYPFITPYNWVYDYDNCIFKCKYENPHKKTTMPYADEQVMNFKLKINKRITSALESKKRII